MAREYLYDVRSDPAPLLRGPQPVRLRSASLDEMPRTGPEADRLIAEQTRAESRAAIRPARRTAQGVYFLGEGGTPRAVTRAPVGVRPSHGYLTAVMTADDWVPDMFGMIRLKVTPSAVDLHRLENGLLSMPQDHDTSKPVGRWSEATVAGGKLIGVAEIGNFKRAREVEQEIVEGARHGISIGFIVRETRLLDRDDPDYEPRQIRIEISKFFPYEASSVAAPMIPSATIQTIKTKRRRS